MSCLLEAPWPQRVSLLRWAIYTLRKRKSVRKGETERQTMPISQSYRFNESPTNPHHPTHTHTHTHTHSLSNYSVWCVVLSQIKIASLVKAAWERTKFDRFNLCGYYIKSTCTLFWPHLLMPVCFVHLSVAFLLSLCFEKLLTRFNISKVILQYHLYWFLCCVHWNFRAVRAGITF